MESVKGIGSVPHVELVNELHTTRVAVPPSSAIDPLVINANDAFLEGALVLKWQGELWHVVVVVGITLFIWLLINAKWRRFVIEVVSTREGKGKKKKEAAQTHKNARKENARVVVFL